MSYMFLIAILAPDAACDLVDRAGVQVSALKLKVVLSYASGDVDNIKEFMEHIDNSISKLPTNYDTVTTAASILGPILQLTKGIMDKVTKVLYYLDFLIILLLMLNRCIQ